MSAEFRSWLPDNAAMPALAQGALADMVDGWSAAWFVGEPLRTLGLLTRVTGARGELRKTAWLVCDGGLAIGLPQSGQATLGAAVLGIAMTGAERPSADLALLERVGGECLDDLKRRAAALFGIEKTAAWRNCEGAPHGGDAVHRIEIGNSVRSAVLMFTLELSADCFTRFVKAKLPAAPTPRKFGAPAQALASLPVTLSVAVGRCGLTVAELSSLAEGDVLVLDRALDAAMPLAVEGVIARRGACTLTEAGDRVALNITEALAA